jgi:hypothetical protein
MSTRAQIAIEVRPGDWAHTYVHYDGYPSHMLPALAPWTPEDILAAREIRQVRADEIEAFERPRDPVILPRPTCQFCHLYVWQDGAWVELDTETHPPEGAPE